MPDTANNGTDIGNVSKSLYERGLHLKSIYFLFIWKMIWSLQCSSTAAFSLMKLPRVCRTGFVGSFRSSLCTTGSVIHSHLPLLSVKKLGASNSGDIVVDLQSDQSKYGRGDKHLSASLEDGDAVIFQTGTWTVDGVEVGDGSTPKIQYAKVDSIQLVWTHNCEHGVIRAIPLKIVDADGPVLEKRFVVTSPIEIVEFGPEQLLARIPDSLIKWNDGAEEGVLLVDLPLFLDGQDYSCS